MADWIKTGENPQAAGQITYGREGRAPGFTLDSQGNITLGGTLTAVGGVGGWSFDVRSYGAVGDGQGVTDGAMTNGSPTLTVTPTVANWFLE